MVRCCLEAVLRRHARGAHELCLQIVRQALVSYNCTSQRTLSSGFPAFTAGGMYTPVCPGRRALEHQGNFDMLRSLTCHLQARPGPTPCTRRHASCMRRAGANSRERAHGGHSACAEEGEGGLRRRAQAHQGGMGMVGVSPRYAQRAAHKFSQFWRLPHRARVVKVGTPPERRCCRDGPRLAQTCVKIRP